MRRTILFILFLGLFYFGAGGASAQCACDPIYIAITAHNEFKLAHVVFVGKVIEIKRTASDIHSDRYTEIVKFKVQKTWKRDLETIVTITNEVHGCRHGFKEKEEWLIYAYKQQDGTLGTDCCCSRTKQLSKATGDIKEFETKGEKPTRIIDAAN